VCSCKNRHFRRTYRLHHHGGNNLAPGSTLALTSKELQLLVSANVEEWRLLGCYALWLL
jgi:hypothetical protein